MIHGYLKTREREEKKRGKPETPTFPSNRYHLFSNLPILYFFSPRLWFWGLYLIKLLVCENKIPKAWGSIFTKRNGPPGVSPHSAINRDTLEIIFLSHNNKDNQVQITWHLS